MMTEEEGSPCWCASLPRDVFRPRNHTLVVLIRPDLNTTVLLDAVTRVALNRGFVLQVRTETNLRAELACPVQRDVRKLSLDVYRTRIAPSPHAPARVEVWMGVTLDLRRVLVVQFNGTAETERQVGVIQWALSSAGKIEEPRLAKEPRTPVIQWRQDVEENFLQSVQMKLAEMCATASYFKEGILDASFVRELERGVCFRISEDLQKTKEWLQRRILDAERVTVDAIKALQDLLKAAYVSAPTFKHFHGWPPDDIVLLTDKEITSTRSFTTEQDVVALLEERAVGAKTKRMRELEDMMTEGVRYAEHYRCHLLDMIINSSIMSQSKATRRFRDLFGLEDEVLLAEFNGALLKTILRQGTIFVTYNYVAFYSNVLGLLKTQEIFSFREFKSVERARTAFVFPNAIVVKMIDNREIFLGSLFQRDHLFSLLDSIMQIRLDREDLYDSPTLPRPSSLLSNDLSEGGIS